jgi:hypothetical protein
MRRSHSSCTHLDGVKRVTPSGEGCVEVSLPQNRL